MRIALLYFSQSNNSTFTSYAKEVEKGIIENTHFVDLMPKGNVRSLTGYKNIVIGYENESMLGGKTSDGFIRMIKSSGDISGKYCYVFVNKKLRSNALLRNLMRLLEKEGLIICSSEIITSKEEGFNFGKRLNFY